MCPIKQGQIPKYPRQCRGWMIGKIDRNTFYLHSWLSRKSKWNSEPITMRISHEFTVWLLKIEQEFKQYTLEDILEWNIEKIFWYADYLYYINNPEQYRKENWERNITDPMDIFRVLSK